MSTNPSKSRGMVAITWDCTEQTDVEYRLFARRIGDLLQGAAITDDIPSGDVVIVMPSPDVEWDIKMGSLPAVERL